MIQETPPLLVWREMRVATALAAEREGLRQRIEKLPAHSFRRVELTAQLRAITARQLRLEARMGSGR